MKFVNPKRMANNTAIKSNVYIRDFFPLLSERPFRVVSHSTEASKSPTDISWTKGQSQGFLSKILS